MAGGLKRILKFAFWLAAFAFWLATIVLLLEVTAYWLDAREIRGNPLIAAYVAGEPLGIPERPAPLTLPAAEAVSLPAPPPAPQGSAGALGAVQHPSDCEAHGVWREAFLQMDDGQREIEARIGQHIVLHLDASGTLLDAWGSFAIRSLIAFLHEPVPVRGVVIAGGQYSGKGLETLQRVVRKARDAQEAGRQAGQKHAHVDAAQPEAFPCGYVALEDPAEAGSWFVFIAFDFVELSRLLHPAPSKDSPWDVLWTQYKAHYSGGPGPMGDSAFRTNALGLRDDDIVAPKPPGVFRILCVGGSTTEEGPANARTYPNLLESMLNESFGEVEVDVVNCGISGINSDGHVGKLPLYLSLEPDLLLLYMGVNDAMLVLLYPDSSLEAAYPMAGMLRSVRRWAGGALRPGPVEAARRLEAFTLANVEALAEAAARAGAGAVLASVARPDISRLSQEERGFFEYRARNEWHPLLSFDWYVETMDTLNARYAELAAAHELMFIPAAEHLSGGAEIFQDICHMRPASIEQKAAVMAHYLRPVIARRLETAEALP